MRKSASFKLMNFMAPGSEVLVLRQGSNDYLGLGSVITTSYFFFRFKICLIISLYVMLQLFDNFVLEFRKCIELNTVMSL